MTAEIAILNKSAVAMAADSAVTFGPKIYNSVNKLFSLSKYEPVGIMIYNNAQLMEVPIEIIIKQFREHLGKESKDSLLDYADEFICFIENCDIFDEKVEWDAYDLAIKRHFSDISSIIQHAMNQYFKSRPLDELKNSEAIKIVEEEIGKIHSNWVKVDFRDGFEEPNVDEFIERFQELFESNIDSCFHDFTKERSEIKRKLFEICSFLFLKKEFANNYSGIVIAGYGKNDLYPKITSYQVSFSIDRNLKYTHRKHKQISTLKPASIFPFAQSQISDLFIYNIHPALADFQRGYLSKIPSKINEILDEAIKKTDFGDEVIEIKDEINQQVQELFTIFDHNFIQYQRDVHVNPLYQAVSVLPKDELATLAESLVNLTSFKQKMSMDSETVGGPIDVAVISKGDGFIWIDRKHYFDKKLNHSFFKNYFGQH